MIILNYNAFVCSEHDCRKMYVTSHFDIPSQLFIDSVYHFTMSQGVKADTKSEDDDFRVCAVSYIVKLLMSGLQTWWELVCESPSGGVQVE